MGVPIKPPFVLMLGGTSLTSGRLCNPPIPWTKYLYEDMIGAAECQGPVIIINTGKGSQTSDFGATQAALMAPLKPTHVLMEDFGINDCAIGPVSIPQATANFNSMVASYRASNPGVIIVHQTMSPASAGDASRTNLATYYTNGLANAVINGLLSLDNYGGTAIVPGGWVKPLPVNLTVGSAPPASAPSGFFAVSPTATWSGSDKSADVTVSADLLTATRGATGSPSFASLRATQGQSTGKYYFETTVTFGAGAAVGVGTSAASLANYVGSGVSGWGYAATGDVLNAGVAVATIGTYASGDKIGVALDMTNARVWFRKNTGLWNNSAPADPTTNVGGIAVTAGTYFPMSSLFTVGDTSVANFGIAGDGLHPLWANAFEIYSYPNIKAWAIQAMADFW